MTPDEFEAAFWAIDENGKPFAERMDEMLALFKGQSWDTRKPLVVSQRFVKWAVLHQNDVLDHPRKP